MPHRRWWPRSYAPAGVPRSRRWHGRNPRRRLAASRQAIGVDEPRVASRPASAGSGDGRDGRGAGELRGPRRVATVDRAQGAEAAPITQCRRTGPEVIVLARPLDGRPHRRGPLAGAAYGLFGRLRLDDNGLAQVHQADPDRPPAQDLLAQKRIELHPAEALLLLVDRRDAAGLVVHDFELAFGGDI